MLSAQLPVRNFESQYTEAGSAFVLAERFLDIHYCACKSLYGSNANANQIVDAGRSHRDVVNGCPEYSCPDIDRR